MCLFWLNEAEVVVAARISTIQTTLNNRLTTAATAGDTALTDDITTITDDTPEVAVVILADTGADPLNYPYLVRGLCVQPQPTSFVWHQKPFSPCRGFCIVASCSVATVCVSWSQQCA